MWTSDGKKNHLENCISSLPLNLCLRPSEFSSKEYEVWSLTDIPMGVRFGPNQSIFIDQIKHEKEEELLWKEESREKITTLASVDKREWNWLQYVNCAPSKEQQNLIAFQSKLGVYFLTCKLIPARTELLVWYQGYITAEKAGCNLNKTGNSDYVQGNVLQFNKHYKGSCIHDINKYQLSKNDVDFKTHSLPMSIGTYVKSDAQQEYSVQKLQKHENYKKVSETKYRNEKTCQSKANCQRINYKEEIKRHKSAYISSAVSRCISEQNKTIASKQQTPTIERLYKCKFCRWKFTKRKKLICHENICVSQTVHECKLCGKIFIQACKLVLHKLCHKIKTTGNWKISGKTSIQVSNHKRIQTNKKSYDCKCRKKYTYWNSKSNEGMQIVENLHKSNVCTQKGSLKSNERIHTGKEDYERKVPRKKFAHFNHLKVHKMIHTGKSCYKCSVCGKVFTRKGCLKIHQHNHTSKKPYECNECAKKFVHWSTLKQHERIHTGDRPYKCSMCGESFAEKRSFRVHESIHTGKNIYECKDCGKKFMYIKLLKRHERIHNGECPYKCNICGRAFSENGYLKSHERVHKSKVCE